MSLYCITAINESNSSSDKVSRGATGSPPEVLARSRSARHPAARIRHTHLRPISGQRIHLHDVQPTRERFVERKINLVEAGFDELPPDETSQ